MGKKIFAWGAMFALILAIAPSSAVANGITTLNTKQNVNSWYTYLDDRNSNISVTLQETVTNKTTLHHSIAEANYELAVEVPQRFWIPENGNRMREVRGKYQKVSYEKAIIETRGNVITKRFDANPFMPDLQKSGPGLTYLRVSATTDTDHRTPPREVREYTMVLHLTDVVGVLQDGTPVPLGSYEIVFGPLQFVFFHDPAALPHIELIGGCCGGGQIQSPAKDGSENVKGPAPILSGEEITIQIPAGLDAFKIDDAGFNVQLPPDFFGPGSEPFEGTVKCDGQDGLGTDTTVERKSDIILPPSPSQGTIPIEMVELNLVSCQPIVIQNNDGSQQQLDVRIELSEIPSLGEMNITRTDENGGTFNAQLFVQPRFIFTQVGDEELTPITPIDPGYEFITEPQPIVGPIIGRMYEIAPPAFEFNAVDIPWIKCPDIDTDFCPGILTYTAQNGWANLQPLKLDADELITWEEMEKLIQEKITEWINQNYGGDPERAYRAADDKDYNGDGKLNEDEVVWILKQADVEIPWYLTYRSVAKAIVDAFDENGDGKLSLEEFKRAIGWN